MGTLHGANTGTYPGMNRARIQRFITEDIWDIDLSSLSRVRRIGVNAIRVLNLVFKGYWANDCPVHASALTYTTLISIVPVLALALSVLRGFGAAAQAEQEIMSAASAMPEQFQFFVQDILNYVNNTSFSVLGGLGLAFLLVTVVMVLSQVESSFNRVWGVQVPRTILRKFSEYLSVLVVVPVLMVAATTINATLSNSSIVHAIEGRYVAAAAFYLRLLKLTPFVATWIAFSFLYKFMPNTRVRLGPALISGIIGGSLWIAWQWVYITFQIGMKNYNAIYATFATVLIFLLWLNISWQIILLGAEIGFGLQNHSTFAIETRSHSASMKSRISLAIAILAHASKAMLDGVQSFCIPAFAQEHGVPVRLLNEVVNELVKTGFLAPIWDPQGPGNFVLLRSPDKVPIQDVINALLNSGASPQSLGLHRLQPAVLEAIARIETSFRPGLDQTLADLHRQAPA